MHNTTKNGGPLHPILGKRMEHDDDDDDDDDDDEALVFTLSSTRGACRTDMWIQVYRNHTGYHSNSITSLFHTDTGTIWFIFLCTTLSCETYTANINCC